MAPGILTASVPSLGPIRGTAAVFGLGGRFQISTRLGLEFRLTARAAEQHLVAVMRCAMGRIWLHRHAADGIAHGRRIVAVTGMVVVAVVVTAAAGAGRSSFSGVAVALVHDVSAA